MLKIVFLHGLESSNKSSKVLLMRDLGFEVMAPKMDYRDNPILFEKTLDLVRGYQPQLIVGSSMGGYFAFHLGTHYKTNLLLLNPALPIRTIEPLISTDGSVKSKIWALVGVNDDIVPPNENISILERAGAKVSTGNHAHRTHRIVFEKFLRKVLLEI